MRSKAFSMIEVLISVTLLSTVLIILLDIKGQNIFIVNKTKNISFLNAMIGLVAFHNTENQNKQDLKNLIVDTNDNLRKQIKNIKVESNKIFKDKKMFKVNDQIISQENYTNKFTINNTTKIFYSFRLNL